MKPLPSTVAVRRRLACLCAGASLALATPAFSSESVVLDDFADLALSPAWVVGPSLVTDASAGHLVVRGTGGVSNLHLPLPFGRITRGTVTLELDFFLPVTSGRHVVGFGLVDSPGGSGWAAVGGADRYIMTDQVDPVDPELTFPPQILAKAGQWTDNLLPTGPAGGAQQGVWHYIRIEYDLDAGEHRFYTRLRDDAGEPTLVATNPLGQSALEFFVIGAARATAVEQPDSAGARFDNIRAAINREAEGFTRIPHAEPGAWVRTPGLFGGAPPAVPTYTADYLELKNANVGFAAYGIMYHPLPLEATGGFPLENGQLTVLLDFWQPLLTGAQQSAVGFSVLPSIPAQPAEAQMVTNNLFRSPTTAPHDLAAANAAGTPLISTKGVWHRIRIEYDLENREKRFFSKERDAAGDFVPRGTSPFNTTDSTLRYFALGVPAGANNLGARFANFFVRLEPLPPADYPLTLIDPDAGTIRVDGIPWDPQRTTITLNEVVFEADEDIVDREETATLTFDPGESHFFRYWEVTNITRGGSYRTVQNPLVLTINDHFAVRTFVGVRPTLYEVGTVPAAGWNSLTAIPSRILQAGSISTSFAADTAAFLVAPNPDGQVLNLFLDGPVTITYRLNRAVPGLSVQLATVVDNQIETAVSAPIAVEPGAHTLTLNPLAEAANVRMVFTRAATGPAVEQAVLSSLLVSQVIPPGEPEHYVVPLTHEYAGPFGEHPHGFYTGFTQEDGAPPFDPDGFAEGNSIDYEDFRARLAAAMAAGNGGGVDWQQIAYSGLLYDGGSEHPRFKTLRIQFPNGPVDITTGPLHYIEDLNYRGRETSLTGLTDWSGPSPAPSEDERTKLAGHDLAFPVVPLTYFDEASEVVNLGRIQVPALAGVTSFDYQFNPADQVTVFGVLMRVRNYFQSWQRSTFDGVPRAPNIRVRVTFDDGSSRKSVGMTQQSDLANHFFGFAAPEGRVITRFEAVVYGNNARNVGTMFYQLGLIAEGLTGTPDPFAAWLDANNVPADQRGPADTPLSDGIGNYLRWALDLPYAPGAGFDRLPGFAVADGQATSSFIIRNGVSFTVEFSSLLAGWQPAPAGALTVTDLGNGFSRIEVALPTAEPSLFLRLKVAP